MKVLYNKEDIATMTVDKTKPYFKQHLPADTNETEYNIDSLDDVLKRNKRWIESGKYQWCMKYDEPWEDDNGQIHEGYWTIMVEKFEPSEYWVIGIVLNYDCTGQLKLWDYREHEKRRDR